MARLNPPQLPTARTQRGAVLFIALIMLILMTLIGLVGMQVASMQERMSSNYRAANLSFQRTEGVARSVECALDDIVNRTTTAGCNVVAAADVSQACDDGFDPATWAEAQTLASAPAINTRLIGRCISGNAALDMGLALSEDANPIYQITVFGTDLDTDPTAFTAIDTIFRP